MVLIKLLQGRPQSHTYANVAYLVLKLAVFYSQLMVHPTSQIPSPRESEEEFKPLHSAANARCALFY